jgi:hypothetical protein
MILLIRTILLASLSFFHPYYVSVTEVEYSTKDHELGMSMKFFPDDIEAALKQMSGGKVDITKGNKTENEKLLTAYVIKHFSVKLDGKAVSPQFLGYENDQGATWCYFSVKNVSSPHTIQIFNNFLYEYRKDQLNFVHAIVDGNRKTVQLAMPENSVTFTFP